MSIKFNGTSITGVTYNGVALTKVTYNGTVVYETESTEFYAPLSELAVPNGRFSIGCAVSLVQDSEKGEVLKYESQASSDPYCSYTYEDIIDAIHTYSKMEIMYKADTTSTRGQYYFMYNWTESFCEEDWAINNDGEWHTIDIDITGKTAKDTCDTFRLDPENGDGTGIVYIKSIRFHN